MDLENTLQQGINLVKKGLLKQASILFEGILEVYPEDPSTLFNTAVVLDQLGQKKRAQELLNRSICADRTFANPHYYMGQLHIQSKEYHEAYLSFREAIACNVEFTPAYEGLKAASDALQQPVIYEHDAEIVFYTGGKAFHAKTMEEKGLGGSESALIYMARALAADGRKVRVFCNCEQPGIFDGVRYDTLTDFHIFRKFHAVPLFISSRSLRPFKLNIKATKRILWIHDDINVAFMEGEKPAQLPIDRIFAISNWQSNEWSRHFNIPKEHFFLTRNGTDLSVFKPDQKRKLNRLIYTSRPCRGLDILLKLFPYIRKQVPDTELHIFTYHVPEDNLDNSILQNARQPGVFVRGSMPKQILAAEIAMARLMLYPSIFRETSCISAIEAQSAGTPVIASDSAALKETVQDGISGFLIPGNPHSSEFGRHFIKTVVYLLKNNKAWTELSYKARKRCEMFYDWRIIANEWLTELSRITNIRHV